MKERQTDTERAKTCRIVLCSEHCMLLQSAVSCLRTVNVQSQHWTCRVSLREWTEVMPPQAEPVRSMLSQRSLSFGAACDVGPSPMGATITPVLGSGPTGPTAGTFAAGAGGGRTIASKRLATPPPAIAHAPADAAPDAAAEGAPLWAAADASEASAVRRGAVDARPPGLVSHTSVRSGHSSTKNKRASAAKSLDSRPSMPGVARFLVRPPARMQHVDASSPMSNPS